ncbi:MAG: hypothetical protein ABIP94_02390 [Planctomycetota bacterium]
MLGLSLLGLGSLGLAVASGCSKGGGGVGSATPGATTQAALERVEFGRLADVYGLRVTTEGASRELFRRDVLVGPNIRDERPTTSNLLDSEITYDFIAADPDTLQPRLFIPRDTTSPEFAAAFDALDNDLRQVAPMIFGQGGPGLPFAVVPRNGAIRLTFSAPLGVGDEFFVERDTTGQVVGLRNTEAVQLLQIVGDPTQPGGFVPLPVRVVVQDRSLVLDPVLLGTEGLQYQTTNNAAGLPASPDQLGANIRIAVALEGPLAIPGLRESATTGLIGLNNRGRQSLIRDFRSGNANDTSADLARGFVRDPLPLRIVGEILMYLERVDNINAFTQEVTVYKNGIAHEIDSGDVFRFIAGSTAVPISTEVVVDPEDDRNQPANQHVRVRVRRLPNLEALDPRNLSGYPTSLAAREPWLVANAPKAICVAEYTAGGDTVNNVVTGDDPRNFLAFTPAPQANLDGSQPAPNQFVSPFAGAVVRFTKPIDLETVKWADTFFFATRDLATQASIEDFIVNRPNSQGTLGMNPATFNLAKYRTPYLITARLFDEDGSQTTLRLQPTAGFYLDDTMRNPPVGADYRYFLHLIANSPDGGVKDLAGNAVDLQGTTADRSNQIVIPFTVDTRFNGNQPFFDDNLSISIVRRFGARDEDAQPSYFIPAEVQATNAPSIAAAYPLEDMFGGYIYLDGKLQARPTTRTRVTADNLNQAPLQQQPAAPALPNPLAWCPQYVNVGASETQVGTNSATNVVNAGIQNPLNPFGCRLQTVWREVDLSLSRTDAFDFDLDIEQMYWAPYTQTNLSFDEFDRVSLWLGHSEFRPVPCVGDFSSLPSLPDSGLRNEFEKNFAWNPTPGNANVIQSQAPRQAAYVDSPMTIDPSKVVYEANGVNRFLPLPAFKKPYFVYRDETVVEQGGNSLIGSDLQLPGYIPYILSPFSHGQGRRWIDTLGTVGFVTSFWNDAPNFNIGNPSNADSFTGGLVGSIALPLIADFWTYCDSSELPLGGGYVALGTNGWQVSVTVQSGPQPNFRVLSGGRPATTTGQPAVCRAPGQTAWTSAQGAFVGQTTATTPPGDNTFYWIMMDVLKRQSVITAGFVDLNNPHRVPEGFADPRLGPFYLQNGQSTLPANVLPSFAYEFDPPLQKLPPGTSLVPQFRAASAVDATPWYWDTWIRQPTPLFQNLTPQVPGTYGAANSTERTQLRPTAANFPLDPYKAGDAHIRKWDVRLIPGSGQARNWWTYFYNRTVTRYVEDPNELLNPAFTAQFAGPNEGFTPRDIRYVNWRFVTSNNVDANPPVSPTIETFALSYRFLRQ